MSGIDHTRSLLNLALDEFKAARVMAGDVENFTDAIFGFHIQQIIEKCLKAWLSALEVEYSRGHDLHRLLVLLEEQGVEVEAFSWVDEFNPFAVQFRYEAPPGDEPLERNLALTRTGLLLQRVWEVVNGLTPQPGRATP